MNFPRLSLARKVTAVAGAVLSMWIFAAPAWAQDPELGEGKFFEKTPEGIVERDPASPEAQGRPAASAAPRNEAAGRPTQVAGVQVVRAAGGAVSNGAPGLARTGADTTDALLWLGGTALGLGGALMAVARRRPVTP